MCELLAPAGSYESIKAAVNAGADAVYTGGLLFGARAYADNPDEEQLLRGMDYCHLHGRKLYLTVNTLLKERELETVLGPYLLPYYENGLDGVIIQDFGVLRYVRERFPGLLLHASTQMTITGAEGVRLLQSEGVSRVVVARELSLKEIREITEKTGAEVEVFVHGAMCCSYSGQCLFSSLLGGRSGNRGRCAQPCRLPYRMKNTTSHLLSMKDMCAIDLIPEILDAGVVSLKIEGRMKSPEYTAGVVSVYRRYLDLYRESGEKDYRVKKDDHRLLLDLYSRGDFSQGYYHTHNGREMMTLQRPSYSGTAETRQRIRERYLAHEIRKKIAGELSIGSDGPAVLTLRCGQICVSCSLAIAQAAQNRPTDEAAVRRQMTKTGNTPFEFDKLDIALADGLFIPIAGLNELRRMGLALLETQLLKSKHRDSHAEADGIAVASLKPSAKLHEENRNRRLNILVTDGRQLQAVLESSLSDVVDTVYLDSLLFAMFEKPQGRRQERNGGREDDAVQRAGEILAQLKRRGWNCFLNCPPVLRGRERKFLESSLMRAVLPEMDGFLLHTVDQLSYFQEYIKENRLSAVLAADDNLYAYNSRAAVFLRDHGVVRFTLPAELNCRELRELERENAELPVYGYQPLMQSAQCVLKNTVGCVKTPQVTLLKDRKNAEFPVLNRCPFCCNTIYNSVPLLLFGCREEIERLAPSRLRLSFTVESKEETERILRECARFLAGDTAVSGRAGTRGHFRRGVE